MIRRALVLLASLLGLWVAMSPAHAAEMLKDFVYLRDIDPTIQQDIRYAGSSNFTGKPVDGYGAAECVLVRQAADALRTVQADLKPKGLSLKIYDCYRPARAVAAFIDWVKGPDDPDAKAIYYPNIAKSALIPDYIASRSGHSRGATVDLTLVHIEDGGSVSPEGGKPRACTAQQTGQAPDGSLAMGTTFDCFDTKANIGAAGISEQEAANREALHTTMVAHGFKDYSPEWWHFTLENEPYSETIFDFPIEPRE